MITIEQLLDKQVKISVIGLGYVGLPIAVAFAEKLAVIGFDLDAGKIEKYRRGLDVTNEVGSEALRAADMTFTSEADDLKKAKFHIVAVPTPVTPDKRPDLGPLEKACRTLGANLAPGSVVVFESTVYPGVTEEVCRPILEKVSGLACGAGFKIGYSPERINPGDRLHRLENIVKIVSGQDSETLELVAGVYGLVVKAGVHRAESIKVAEAAKVIENSQRDINIAFMNELAMIFNRLGLDTRQVLRAAETKWNFLNFRPGLVGGHCIGVDPYYLTYKAELSGYSSQVILAGRRLNDGMGRYVAETAAKMLLKDGEKAARPELAVLGFTFKENCPDTRNTRVIDIINELREYGFQPKVADPVADRRDTLAYYGLELTPLESIKAMDCVIAAVAHEEFRGLDLAALLKPGGILLDVKGLYDRPRITEQGFQYWSL